MGSSRNKLPLWLEKFCHASLLLSTYSWIDNRRRFILLSFTSVYNSLYLCTHAFNGPLSGTTRVSRYQKGKTSLDFTEARDSEWQWHQLGHMQVCSSLQTDNHASTPPIHPYCSFLKARCHSCRPTNSVKALKAQYLHRPV